jgi:heme exporter protein B
LWRKALAITWKDALSEMRTKEIISSVVVFTILVIVIFSFAFGGGTEILRQAAGGILWVTFAFAGVLSLTRAFIPEKEEGCLEGLMVAPLGRDVVYVGKMLGSLVFMIVIEVIALPIFTLLFNLNVFRLELIVVTLLTTVGFVSVGTLFSALAVNTKAREMVLPILFLPIVTPLVIAAVNASELVLGGESWGAIASWVQIIVAFDVIFLVVSFLIFGFVIEE